MNEISHLFVKLTNLFQSKIVTTKVNKIIFFFVFYYRCDSHATKDFTRFHWIIHDHVIHELYCHKNIYRGSDVATCVQTLFTLRSTTVATVVCVNFPLVKNR
jgi:hypothetical protein